MGAPKLKWTSEEEEALRAGIAKHGTGKWKTIIKDPEFSTILSSRSNVDLKDKWRNINVFSTHGGSREKAREAVKRNQQQIVKKPDDQMMVVYEEQQLVVAQPLQSVKDQAIDAKPVGIIHESFMLPSAAPKKKITRLDNVVLEAITSLKEPRGSNKTNISIYIEDQYDALPDFKRLLPEMLKTLTEGGKLIKVNHKYRIAPPCASFPHVGSSAEPLSEGRQTEFSRGEKVQMQFPPQSQADAEHAKMRSMPQVRSFAEPLPERRQTDFYRSEKVQMRYLTKPQVDAELDTIRSMTTQEAALAAARAVAEAEAALAEAEQAEIDALAAEADAEEAQAFAEAAMMALKNITTHNMMVRA